MANQTKLLRQLLDHLDAYQNEVGNNDIKEFALFLKDRTLLQSTTPTKTVDTKTEYLNYKSIPSVEFSTLLVGLYRFAKHYTKKAFVNSSLRTIDEFGFLATLLREGSLLKNELINQHFLETSSGSEVMKRLIKTELISEFPDPNDGRAKRVSLTQKGRMEIFKAFEEMMKVSKIVKGNLSDEELLQSLEVLNKLTYFHQHIHQTDRGSDLDLLESKFITNKVQR